MAPWFPGTAIICVSAAVSACWCWCSVFCLLCSESLLAGWELLGICLSFFSPSPKFQSYLDGHIFRTLDSRDHTAEVKAVTYAEPLLVYIFLCVYMYICVRYVCSACESDYMYLLIYMCKFAVFIYFCPEWNENSFLKSGSWFLVRTTWCSALMESMAHSLHSTQRTCTVFFSFEGKSKE